MLCGYYLTHYLLVSNSVACKMLVKQYSNTVCLKNVVIENSFVVLFLNIFILDILLTSILSWSRMYEKWKNEVIVVSDLTYIKSLYLHKTTSKKPQHQVKHNMALL